MEPNAINDFITVDGPSDLTVERHFGANLKFSPIVRWRWKATQNACEFGEFVGVGKYAHPARETFVVDTNIKCKHIAVCPI
jgi:hypothetical protein